MAGNPKGSGWRSTPRELRKRKPINVTLSDESLVILDELAAEEERSRSQVLEDALKVYKTSRIEKSTG